MFRSEEYEVAINMWSKGIRNVNELAPLAKFILEDEFVRLDYVQDILDVNWDSWERGLECV